VVHGVQVERRYSTTLGALRNARAEWRRAQAAITSTNSREPETTYVLAHWVFAGTGLAGGIIAAALGAYIVFEDEAGFSMTRLPLTQQPTTTRGSQ
jgi:hypothetical protein